MQQGENNLENGATFFADHFGLIKTAMMFTGGDPISAQIAPYKRDLFTWEGRGFEGVGNGTISTHLSGEHNFQDA